MNVRQLYEYAVKHDLLDSDANLVMQLCNETPKRDFSNIVEYTYEDVIALFST